MIPWIRPNAPFPPESLWLNANGLICAGADLSPERLLSAYRQGIFPWYSPGEPILWWSPDPRMTLLPVEYRLHRSLRKRLRRNAYEVWLNCSFPDVINACADAPRPGQSGSWISDEMIEAYCKLHELGFAHSLEVRVNGEIAGGLYGVVLGRVFFGESMFARQTDMSKIALAHLVYFLYENQFELIDCQMNTRHLAFHGAREIPRCEFLEQIRRLTNIENPVWTKQRLWFDWANARFNR